MSKLQQTHRPLLKNNVLPFPSLQHAPRDPWRKRAWRTFGTLLVIAVMGALVVLMVSSFME